MPRRLFLDVGAHRGESLAAAVEPRWRFDAICCFEPASSCLPDLEALADDRVTIVRVGWAAAEGTATLHDPGEIGASIHPGKARTGATEEITLLDAAGWMAAHVRDDDVVWLKINCEGAECDVLDRLLDSGEMRKVDHLLVHFDVEKIPGMEHRAAETRRRLDDAGVAYLEAKEILFGRSHPLKTANWLAWTEAGRLGRLRHRYLNRATFRARQLLYPLKVRVRGG